MKIDQAEISLFKTSDIKDGDVLLVKISSKYKEKLNKENIQSLYDSIKAMVGSKDVGIFFFPKNLDISILRNYLEKAELIANSGSENKENS
jgi:hypothetical protein